ncbi:MAG: glycosyltransferase family 4 protein [Sedimentisphaerales bacterium]|nr:glycosyltransferase family 4 protein [Sedimentisphaerales bacterium]
MAADELIKHLHFGFVSTRFSGTDGVSLEARKWAEVLARDGFESFWFGGQLDHESEQSMEVPEAFFEHPENQWINGQVFGHRSRTRECTARIQAEKSFLKDKLYEFIEAFNIDIIVAENCLTIPMHIPLGLALTEVLAETCIPAVAHHHDFYWERDRYAINAAADYLQMAFPPKLANLRHAVINTPAQEQLAHRTGIAASVIPNVHDFNIALPEMDGFSSTFRQDIGLSEKDIMILQPTRIVSRKGIEHAIELVRRLKDPKYILVVSHDAGDEGPEYREFLTDYAMSVGVDMRLISRQMRPRRWEDEKNGKFYSLSDAYMNADLVTYPSLYEGFGNAFLEAIYFKKPLLVNRYSIFIRDIEPRGFRTVEMDGYVKRSVVEEVRRVLEDKAYREEIVEHNFALGRKYYSYEVLERRLRSLRDAFFGAGEF